MKLYNFRKSWYLKIYRPEFFSESALGPLTTPTPLRKVLANSSGAFLTWSSLVFPGKIENADWYSLFSNLIFWQAGLLDQNQKD